jgi:thiosulfate dehydrogenase
VRYWRASLAVVQLIAVVALGKVILAEVADAQTHTPHGPPWTIPEIGALPHDAHGTQVRDGRDLITATYAHIGPNVPDTAKRFAGNNLEDFPQYSARTGTEISIEDRINSCMTRSMNGRPLPADSPEMQAMVAYIKFISSGVKPDQRLPGLGTGHMPLLDRAASPKYGAPLFRKVCADCHNSNGSGVSNGTAKSDLGYLVPPLWGEDSYNDGAGMARLITFANFIHFNMPHGTDYVDPQLSVEHAWDIAAFVLSHRRPHLDDIEHDFPDLLKKPVDAPYGPYADRFSERQHKYGPFAPIEAALARLKPKH